jgi:glycosyltransferase involved in cell wall biosynthesis/O-antigen/teichoic acid export membrane protein
MIELPRKRILIVAFCCDPHGTMEERNGWHRALIAAQKYDVTVFYWPKSPPVDLHQSIPEEQVPHLRFIAVTLSFPYQWMMESETGFYMAYRQWHRQVHRVAADLHAEYPFDLTHLVSLCGFREPGYVWKLGIPNVWGPIGGSHHFPFSMLRIIDIRSRIREIARTVINYCQLHYSRRIRQAALQSTVLAATKNSAHELERGLGVETRVDLETGIDYDIRPLRSCRDSSRPFRILWAGRLRAWKGLPLLLYSLAELPSSLDYRVRIMGDGDCKECWQQLAKKLGIDHRIEWISWPNYRETLKHYDWADAFAFTSQRDTSGTGLVESLAAGCPLIAVNHQGVADLLEHDCGMPVDVTSFKSAVTGFKNAIVQLAQDSDLWLQKCHAATNYAHQLHWSKRSDWIMQVYDEAIGQRQSLRIDEKRTQPAAMAEETKLVGFMALADQGVVSFTNFATILLLARKCDDQVFAAIALAGQFINYSRSALERLLSASYAAFVHRTDEKAALTGSSLSHATIFTALVTLFAVCAALLYLGYSESKALAFGLLTQCLLLPCQMLRDHFRSLCLSRLQIGFAFVLDIVSCTVQLGLLGMLVYLERTDSLSLSLAWAFANALFVLLWISKPPMQYLIQKSSVQSDWRESWDYSKWLLLGRCLGIASYLFVPWILTLLKGDQQWTLFAKAINLVGLSVLIVTGLNNYFQPLTVKTLHSQGISAMKRAMKRSTAVYMALLAGLCVVYVTVGYQLMNMLYATNDSRQGWLVTVLGINVLTFSLAVIAGNGLAALKLSLASLWGELANFCVSAIVAVPLIMWHGSLGAAMAILSGSLASTLVTLIILRRKLKELESCPRDQEYATGLD